MKKIMKLRKEWKVLSAVIFAVFLFSGYMIYVSASTDVTMSLNTKTVTVGQGQDSSGALYISQLTGNDDNRIDPDPELNHMPNPNNITWKTSDPNIVSFSDGGNLQLHIFQSNMVRMVELFQKRQLQVYMLTQQFLFLFRWTL